MTQTNFIESNGSLEIIRTKELKQIELAIRHQEYLAISANYQSGLSRFLHQIVQHVNTTADMRDYLPIILEYPSWQDDFLVDMSLNIAEKTLKPVKNPSGRKRRFYQILNEKGIENLLKSAFGKSEKNIIYFIDNFHTLDEEKQRQFVRDIRQLQSYRAKSAYIKRILFVIGANLYWQNIDPQRISPFSNAASKIFLEDFAQEEVVLYVSTLFKKHGYRVSDIAAEYFYEMTQGHPYFVDSLCKMMLIQPPAEIGCRQIEQAVSGLLEQGDRHLQNIREKIYQYAPDEIAPLISVLQGKVVRKSTLQPNPGLDKLILLGILTCDKDNRVHARNSIYSRFLRSDPILRQELFRDHAVVPDHFLCHPMVSANKRGYCIINKMENSLRNLIVAQLYKHHGEEWLERGLQGIRTEPERDKVNNKAEKELHKVLQLRQAKEHADLPVYNPSDPLIGYATLKELEIIVIKNWGKIFRMIIGSQDRFKVYLTILNRIRNKLAHNRKISDEEIIKLREIEQSFKGCLGSLK